MGSLKIRNKRIIKVPRKILSIQLFLLVLILLTYKFGSSLGSDEQLMRSYIKSDLEIPDLEFSSPWMNDSVHLTNSYEFVNSEISKIELIKDFAYVWYTTNFVQSCIVYF